jgi:uridine kinase
MAPRVIGIAGPPGSGKSTLAAALAARLGDAAVIDMDHYQRITDWPIEHVADWLARGADHDELPVPLLAEHLAQLRGGQAVTDPATGAPIQPRAHLLLETHFGRAHGATGSHIDRLVWLDTPADVALARNLRGFLATLQRLPANVAAWAGELRWIDGYLANYIDLVARLVRLQAERVRPGADLCIDGDRPVLQIADDLTAWLEAATYSQKKL